MMTVIGITGTRNGANPAQLAELRERLARFTVMRELHYLHHGDCVGVDAQAHELALEFGMLVHCHPPIDKTYRAYTTGWHTLWREASYRARNQAIVDACDILLAVPDRPASLAGRSGTWMTVRMAERAGKPNIVIKGDRW